MCHPFTCSPIPKYSPVPKICKIYTFVEFCQDHIWETGGHFRTLPRIFCEMFACVCWEKSVSIGTFRVGDSNHPRFKITQKHYLRIKFCAEKEIINQFD